MGSYILAFTGASGAVYGIRLLEELIAREHYVTVLSTDAGKIVLSRELDLDIRADREAHSRLVDYLSERGIRSGTAAGDASSPAGAGVQLPESIPVKELIRYYRIDDIAAPIASGSHSVDGMIVVPCSMSSLSGIAYGRSGNLLERAADVCLKEGRPLLLAPREMPFNVLHLENMLRLAKSGVIIAPPIPGFYHRPESIRDIVDFVVGKILSRMRIEQNLFSPWEG